jgi:glucokinase
LIRVKPGAPAASNIGTTDMEETEMVEHSRQALVGAIGGTYISLAIADIDELTLSNFALLNSASFKTPMEAIQRYLKSVPRCPDKVGLAVAGHVDGEKVAMSHLPWSFDWNDIRAVTGAKYVTFVNEFEALALAVPRMSAYDLLPIRHGKLTKHGTKLAISAGTGLGSAALIWSGDKWFATSGESAQATFPAVIADEFDIRSALSSDGSLAAGDVLTGQGLVALYNALLQAASGGGTPIPMTPEEITKAGLSGENEVARVALDLMTVWLGRFAGDVASHFGTTGGVYLCGGVPSNILSKLNADRFLEGFERGGSERTRLDDVPVYVIKTGADAGMRGAAIALANSLPVRAPAYRRVSA